nr:hypothetical protein [Nitrosomonas nitrosa]
MTLLGDVELRQQLRSTPPKLVLGIGADDIDKQVRGCTINLRVGDIFRPGSKVNEPGSTANARREYALREGETAVIRTIETLKLASNYAAVALPTSHVSMRGLLMTNPGHVDPGYEGMLHVTVINMGREPFHLARGETFIRVMFFRLSCEVAAPFTERRTSPITAELLERLSPDFLSVAARATQAVRSEVVSAERRERIWQIAVPTIAVAVSVGVTSLVNSLDDGVELAKRVTAVENLDVGTRLTKLEATAPAERRMSALEARVDAMDANATKAK